MLTDVKSYFKENFELDLVFIQCGCFYEVYEEDAGFLEDDPKFKFKTFRKGKDLLATGIHVDHVLKLTKKLDHQNLNYVFLSQEKSGNDFIRVSTISNKSDCLGVGFSRSGELLSTTESLSKDQPQQIQNKTDDRIKDNFYSQFMELVAQSTTQARVENHSVIQGSQKFNPKKALKIFFEFEDIDFQDFRFGKHGWESTGALPLDKKRIQEALNKLHGLDFEDSLKILDQL